MSHPPAMRTIRVEVVLIHVGAGTGSGRSLSGTGSVKLHREGVTLRAEAGKKMAASDGVARYRRQRPARESLLGSVGFSSTQAQLWRPGL